MNSWLRFCFYSMFIIIAGCGGGGGNSSGGIAGDTTAPTTPMNLNTTTVSPRQINLSWSWSYDAQGVVGYKIYRDGVFLKSLTGSFTSSSIDIGLSPSTQYCYSVSAYDAANNESTRSAQACATTYEGIPPTVPANLTVTTASQINLSWDASTDNVGVVGYKIYRDGTYLTSVTGTVKTEMGLSPSTTYCYTVSAYDAADNESAQSTQACAKTPYTKLLGTSSYDSGRAIAIDTSGNVYVTGYTSGDLDGNTNRGEHDIFVAKYDAAGIKQWTRQFGSSRDDSGMALATDASGNVYVTGYEGSPSGLGYNFMFLIKFDTLGTMQWGQALGTTLWPVEGKGVATDASGNIYVTGSTSEVLDGNAIMGDADIFVAKYDPAGTKQWIRQLGSTWWTEDAAMAIAVDASGNSYITGTTRGGLDGNTNAGNYDTFLVKYDASGTKQWTRQLGTYWMDVGYGVSVDASGNNIYVTGVTFGDLDGNVSAGARDIFLLKYDATGVKQWTRQLGTSSLDEGNGVAVDTNGNIYVTGYTSESFDGNTHNGGFDIFLVKYNSEGTKQWTRQLGTYGMDVGYGVAVDASGNIYMTGETDGNLDGVFGLGLSNIFVAKYNANGAKQ